LYSEISREAAPHSIAKSSAQTKRLLAIPPGVIWSFDIGCLRYRCAAPGSGASGASAAGGADSGGGTSDGFGVFEAAL